MCESDVLNCVVHGGVLMYCIVPQSLFCTPSVCNLHVQINYLMSLFITSGCPNHVASILCNQSRAQITVWRPVCDTLSNRSEGANTPTFFFFPVSSKSSMEYHFLTNPSVLSVSNPSGVCFALRWRTKRGATKIIHARMLGLELLYPRHIHIYICVCMCVQS